MLYKLHTSEIKENGMIMIKVNSNMPDVPCPCELCGGESFANACGRDDRLHHHGRIHTVDGELKALCRSCAIIENEKWNAKRKV